jgi:hypothetical protein
MLVFSTQFCELLPLPTSLWFNSPPPLPKVKVENIQTVCDWEGWGGGVELCWSLILQEFKGTVSRDGIVF